MSRIRNADEFLQRFREIREKYDDLFAPSIAELRKQYVGTPQESQLNQILEAHVRAYIVNALLHALNWRMDCRPEDGLPNLYLEVPVLSQRTGTIRFFDYLGLERETNKPLLIVETKRPSARLPQAWKPAATYSEIIGRGLAGKKLKGEWNEWLDDLKDYVRSAYERTQEVPRRVVITNGDWLILFLDPADAFLDDGTHDPNRILVFADRKDIEERSDELFLHLERQRVLGETPALTPGELLFHVDPKEIDRVMHGLRLLYIEQQGLYQSSPVIKVAPVVFLRSRYGAWFRVEAPPNLYELPHQYKNLKRHLREVERAAKSLLAEVNRILRKRFKPFPLSKHYGDEDSFAALPGVVEVNRNEFLIVTGDKTHYLLPEPSVTNCPYHDWVECKKCGVPSNPGPIMERSTSPRAFFTSGELHHCAHRDVNSAKASPITDKNRSRCGPRSGKEGQAFCEIWRFEQYLCCRTCVFEEVCTKATVFRLPCQRPRNGCS